MPTASTSRGDNDDSFDHGTKYLVKHEILGQ